MFVRCRSEIQDVIIFVLLEAWIVEGADSLIELENNTKLVYLDFFLSVSTSRDLIYTSDNSFNFWVI